MPTYEIDILTGTDDNVVHPSPCVVSPTAEAAFLMEGTSEVNFVSEPPGTMTFEASWEIQKRQSQSSSTQANVYTASWTPFDPDDFDNATFYVEFIGSNSHASNTYNVYLCSDAAGSNVLVTVPVPPTGGVNTRVLTSDITSSLIAGTLTVKLDQTAAGHDLVCRALRLIIVQVNPTKTVIQVPFNTNGVLNEFDLVAGDNRFLIGGDTGYLEENNCVYFKKIAGAWDANVVEFDFVTVSGNTAIIGSANSEMALWNIDTDSLIVSNTHSGVLNSVDMKTTTIDLSTIPDDTTIGIFSRNVCTWASNTLMLSIQGFIKLSGGISKATVTRHLNNNYPQKLNATSFQATSGVVYTHMETSSGTAGDFADIQYANNVGMTGAATLAGSDAPFTSGLKEIGISGSMTLTVGDNYYIHHDNGSSPQAPGFMLIELTK